MAKKAGKKHTWANPDLAAAMRELRRSSAAQRHTPKPRKGSRQDRLQKAIRDQQAPCGKD